MAKKKPKITNYPRAWREEFALNYARQASVAAGRAEMGCGPEQLDYLIEAHRSIAHARTHLSGIGPHSAKGPNRRSRMWRQIGKVEKKIERATKRMQRRCLIVKKGGR